MYLHLISLLTILMSEPRMEVQKQKVTLSKIKNASDEFKFSQDCIDLRLRPGKCIALAKCPDIVEEFYNEARKISNSLDFQSFVSNSICGFDGMNFLICCGKRIYPNTMIKPPILLQSTPPSNAVNQNFNEQLSQTTVFYFSPLSANTTPLPTASSNNLLPNIVYPSATVAVTPSTTDMDVIIFKPTVQPSNEGAQVIQPIPEQASTQGTLITQTGQAPLETTSTPQTGECGLNRGTINRVVGGNEANRGNYPWIAALGYRDEYDANSLKYLCAGSLISHRYVITSAHCINGNLLLVRLGAHDLSNAAEPGARNYGIKRTVTHDLFDLKSITNDLALIELSETIQMTENISPICLPDDEKFLEQEFVGMNPFLAGWGATKHQGPTSNVLRDVQVPIISRQVCEQSYRTVFHFLKFSEKLICAGNSNVDACQGDSGGPLMLPQMTGTVYHYYLLGIVSFGYECASSSFPGVYSRVAAYMPWIKTNMI